MQVVNRCPVCDSMEVDASPAQLAPFVSHRFFPWRPVYTIGDVADLAAKKPIYRLLSWFTKRVGVGRKLYPLMIAALHCRSCGFVCSDMRPDMQEMARLYCDYRSPSYVRDRSRFEPGYSQINSQIGNAKEVEVRVANLEGLLKRSAIPLDGIEVVLDYGGDAGQFIPDSLPATRKIVYEVSDKAPRAGVEKVSDLAEIPSVNFGMMCHVLEHVSYPFNTLLELKALLGKEGYVYIEVPMEIQDLEPEHLNDRLVQFHEHINFFSRQSVGRLLERAGFEILLNEIVTLELRGAPIAIVSAIGRLVA